ncbi:MerR family transcriptional regulator [Nocardia sp. BMG51109]|uniref:MerR family transcriptional regulator n=1 Tax=Nocardia sp. BMG51109 TaxID=1056816 RepID=UPI00046410DF|nr:MerR family transcriptional regulator [Nocardia sp. BMG51109]
MDEPESGRMWKVGELATEAGLTVRTLHHYDRIGLVCPAQRTYSGHRLYAEADVRRLYQVMALRQLGLRLDTITELMAGAVDVTQVLAAHQDFLAAQLTAIQDLHALVSALTATTESRPATSAENFLELIRRTVMVDDTVKKYFSENQLAQLAARREEHGDEQVRRIESGWAELIPKVDAAIESGVDPSSPEARALAARWMELLEGFHGGDASLRENLYRMQADNADRIESEFGGPSPAQIEFIKAANASR